MAGSLFSIPIFFIVFRETLEAAIILSVLLGLVEQIVRPEAQDSEAGIFVSDWRHPLHPQHAAYLRQQGDSNSDTEKKDDPSSAPEPHGAEAQSTPQNADAEERALALLVRKLRIQIFTGAAAGLLLALAIGAAFIAVWFTRAANLWSKSEEIWEGTFSLIASMIIMVMGLTMLRLDTARAAWRVKLALAFRKISLPGVAGADAAETAREKKEGRTGRWALFVLPFITVLREGMEAVVFVGGVALGQPARAIPLAALVGILCGGVCGVLIYAFASRSTLRTFLVVMTNFILLIGAGLFSKAVGAFQENAFNHLLGADVDDAGGDGPGSFDVRGNVWHLDCCNPENNFDGQGWSIFAALFGWTNSATVGTVLAYVFYWLLAIAALVYMKFAEGRTTLLGRESAAGRRRREARTVDGHGQGQTSGAEEDAASGSGSEKAGGGDSKGHAAGDVSELPR